MLVWDYMTSEIFDVYPFRSILTFYEFENVEIFCVTKTKSFFIEQQGN